MRRRQRFTIPFACAVVCWCWPVAAGAQHVDDLDSLRAARGMAPSEVRPRHVGFDRVAWARAGDPVSGALTVLLVPALFADTDAPATPEDHLATLFFTGPSASGTLREFFDEASGGRLLADGAVSPWYRTSVTWEDGTGGTASVFGWGPGLGAYLLEAIAAADQQLDLGQFDNDGPDGVPNSGDDNGLVDAVAFLFAEVARSCGGTGAWPHKSGLSGFNGGTPYESNDPRPDGSYVRVDGYVLISASECDGTPLATVSVVAHELGHELGLPDIYHPVGPAADAILSVNRRWVLGCFDIMAGGAWGCGAADEFPSFGPTEFSPWTREILGWIDLQVVADVRYQEFVLEPVQVSQRVLEIPLDASGIESLLIEYRPAVGFDEDLPASGVLVYRHNRAGFLRPSAATANPFYRISLLEADGDSTLQRIHAEGGNRGEAADVFSGTGLVGSLSNVTNPATRLDGGSATSVTIHSIVIADGVTRIIVSTADAPGVVSDDGLGTVTALDAVQLTRPVGGGAQPYAVSVTAGSMPDGLEISAVGDALRVDGSAYASGQFNVTIRVEDARGVVSTIVLPLLVQSVVIPSDVLLDGLIGGEGLSTAQRRLLDNDGNANGRLDVGDLRAHLLRP
ncbi:MAG TPA: immune inhibitor A domain-containing protein [Gemmatimonadales bacterium]